MAASRPPVPELVKGITGLAGLENVFEVFEHLLKKLPEFRRPVVNDRLGKLQERLFGNRRWPRREQAMLHRLCSFT